MPIKMSLLRAISKQITINCMSYFFLIKKMTLIFSNRYQGFPDSMGDILLSGGTLKSDFDHSNNFQSYKCDVIHVIHYKTL